MFNNPGLSQLWVNPTMSAADRRDYPKSDSLKKVFQKKVAGPKTKFNFPAKAELFIFGGREIFFLLTSDQIFLNSKKHFKAS